jgi:hypothetical protein
MLGNGSVSMLRRHKFTVDYTASYLETMIFKALRDFREMLNLSSEANQCNKISRPDNCAMLQD